MFTFADPCQQVLPLAHNVFCTIFPQLQLFIGAPCSNYVCMESAEHGVDALNDTIWPHGPRRRVKHKPSLRPDWKHHCRKSHYTMSHYGGVTLRGILFDSTTYCRFLKQKNRSILTDLYLSMIHMSCTWLVVYARLLQVSDFFYLAFFYSFPSPIHSMSISVH